MPNYEYRCTKCLYETEQFRSLDDRNKVTKCPNCDNITLDRAYITPVQVRTEKLSRTFIDGTTAGGGRPESDKFEDFKKIAELENKKMNVSHKSEEYREINKEIAARSGKNK